MDHCRKYLLEQIEILTRADVREENLDPDFIHVHARSIVQICEAIRDCAPCEPGPLDEPFLKGAR